MQIFTPEQLEQAESFLRDNRFADVMPVFEGMAADIEKAQEEEYVATEDTQYFSFANPFERVTYKKVEDDKREIIDVEQRFDKVYADLAFCYIQQERWDEAREALKKAVRWNPMESTYRLNLAELFRIIEDHKEWLGLSYSVFERAYRPEHLVRAYINFAHAFMNAGDLMTSAALIKAALNIAPYDKRLREFQDTLIEQGVNPKELDKEEAEKLLDAQGIPEGANVAVVLSALIFADEAQEAGDMMEFAKYSKIAIDLVGEQNASVLSDIVKEES